MPGVFGIESTEKKKALEGYNQFQLGRVSAVKHFVTHPGVTILTAAVMHAVMHSQGRNESKINTWASAEKVGSVICAHCNCMAG